MERVILNNVMASILYWENELYPAGKFPNWFLAICTFYNTPKFPVCCLNFLINSNKISPESTVATNKIS